MMETAVVTVLANSMARELITARQEGHGRV
jgi:hypothetical protein